ncbi:hypothetical protein TWF281_006302 [Arthrobotrys megalospora]
MLPSRLPLSPLFLLSLSFQLSFSAAGPVEPPSKVTSDVREIVETPHPPDQTTAHTLLPRPVYPAKYFNGLQIRCDEPEVTFTLGRERLEAHGHRFRYYTGRIQMILGLDWDADQSIINQQITWAGKLCENCECNEEFELIRDIRVPGQPQLCPTDVLSFCKLWLNCFCEVGFAEPAEPKPTDIPLWDVFDEFERDYQERLPFPWRNSKALQRGRRPLPDNSPNQWGAPSSNYQLVPGTKEPYYLEGPSRGDRRVPPGLDVLFGETDVAGGSILKRDKTSVEKSQGSSIGSDSPENT